MKLEKIEWNKLGIKAIKSQNPACAGLQMNYLVKE